MKPKYKRLFLLLSIICFAFLYVGLLLYKFSDNLEFFFPPSELHKIKPGKISRVGGLVVKKTFEEKNNNRYEFIITDHKADLTIHYQGVLPALFREGQGIIARGVLVDNIFIAKELLAKHDEYYIPKEVQNSLNSK
jgi:cytochrome c-type biogenesis protein CcmE